jgi:hypothetical protein
MTGQEFPSVETYTYAIVLEDVYAVKWYWLALFIVATLVMLLAALVGMIFGDRTYAPGVLGYCSTMIRDPSISIFLWEAAR